MVGAASTRNIFYSFFALIAELKRTVGLPGPLGRASVLASPRPLIRRASCPFRHRFATKLQPTLAILILHLAPILSDLSLEFVTYSRIDTFFPGPVFCRPRAHLRQCLQWFSPLLQKAIFLPVKKNIFLQCDWCQFFRCNDTALEFVRHPLTPTLSPSGGEGEEGRWASFDDNILNCIC